MGKGQRRKCTFCTRAGFLSSNGQFCAFEQDLVRTFHPAEDPMAWQHSLQTQPPPSAEPAAPPQSTAAPLAGIGWIHGRHSCSIPVTAIWLCVTDPRLPQMEERSQWAQESALPPVPERDSFGVWVMLQPPCNSGGCLAAAGEPRTTGSLSTSLHSPLLQRACFFPHLMNI